MLNSNTTNAEDLRIYQIIDANLDRAREGLRVLEDWARFGLARGDLVKRLKDFRQILGNNHLMEYKESRNYVPDKCMGLTHPAQDIRIKTEDLISSNASRIQEALRVIEEYTRPARIVRNGNIISVPALSERHRIEVEGTEGMDAFLTDGLRSVLTTIQATNMAEYTVRWPQHIDRWLAEGNTTPEHELLKAWKFDRTRPEFTWMKVRCEANNSVREWTVVDYGKDGDGSMARTTGLVTYALASLFATKGPEFCGLKTGVNSPEMVNEATLEYVLDVFKKHGISVS